MALGAARGSAAARIRARATGCAGMRRATVGSPAVAMPGMRGVCSAWTGAAFVMVLFPVWLSAIRLGKTRVSGPGQNFLARRVAFSGHSATNDFAISIESTWTMSGLVGGGV